MPFNLLALDTSTAACSVALISDNKITERYELAARQHNVLLLPMVQSVLDEAGITTSQLDALAFGCGPGSFTGVRIATSVVQGIGFAFDLPVVPISTLRALAQAGYRELQATQVLPSIDACINEVYWGCYIADKQGMMIAATAESVYAPSQVAVPDDSDSGWVGIGDGWDVYHALLQQRVGASLQKWVPHYYPRARDVAALAVYDYAAGKAVAAAQAMPVYLRDNIVKVR